MNYLEYNFISADEQTAEILMALLSEKGFDTFEQNANQLSAYIEEKKNVISEMDIYLADLQQKFIFTWSQKKFEDKNWNEEWEKNFQPIIVADKCIIRAPFHAANEEMEFEILIEPRMSFGTGHHESTYLLVEEMLELNFENKVVCDAGCGTGVLAILAIKKKSRYVFAVDNNEWAYQNTLDNIKLNEIYDEITTELGEIDLMDGKQFDIILANINKPIIIENIPLFFRSLNKGGLLIVSGILENDINDVIKEANNYFFNLISTRTKNDWICAVFQNA